VSFVNVNGHIMIAAGHQERTRMDLTSWRTDLAKSRGRPPKWGGRLGAVDVDLLGFRADLTAVGGHLSPVDAGLTAVNAGLTTVEPALTGVDAPSSVVETARTEAGSGPMKSATA
jgi:hypothetical protein